MSKPQNGRQGDPFGGPRIEALNVAAYRVPTDFPEADGTFAWDATTLVVVDVRAAGRTGLGWSYTSEAAGDVVDGLLRDVVVGRDAFAVGRIAIEMGVKVRNIGRDGVAAAAISAVDVACWDLKARLLDRPLADLLPRCHERVPVYGSGGFTSYPLPRLEAQLAGWVEQGVRMVKMKVGSRPEDDVARVRAARRAIGEAGLFVDANGAYARKQALAFAEAFAPLGVQWFEEPVSSDDVDGLRLIRDRAPAPIDVAAGEYGWSLPHFRRLLEAGAVDVLQADLTRCGGVTGFLAVSALCEAHGGLPLSAHCAPALHVPVACACPTLVHLEYFHDHTRIERLLFDGATSPEDGLLAPPEAPGHGLSLKAADARRYLVG